jgi:hypothetical protein
MRILLITLLATLTITNSFSQLNNNFFYDAKEFSKEKALFQSKRFLFKEVLGVSTEVVQFEITPLAAANSGELTTLLYKCELKQKEGLVLGFYGTFWNEAGVRYEGFGFKNFEKNQAIEFLSKIQTSIEENKNFINEDPDNNNIYFKFDDIDVLISSSYQIYTIRLFWNGMDSSWEKTAFDRSKRRFDRKIK